MGYMGFGMRKEVYKRKPKEAFKKLKPYYKGKSVRPGPNSADREVKIYGGLKPAYKRWWFIVGSILVISAAAYIYYYKEVIQPRRIQDQIRSFENQGIIDFYSQNSELILSVVQFQKSRSGRIRRIGRDLWSGEMVLVLRSYDYNKAIRNRSEYKNNYSSEDPGKEMEDEVLEGSLRVQRLGTIYVAEQYWTYSFRLNNIREINNSFLDYMDTNTTELDGIIRLLADNNLDLYQSGQEQSLDFKKFGKTYSFIFNPDFDSRSEKDRTKFHRIENDVYWISSY